MNSIRHRHGPSGGLLAAIAAIVAALLVALTGGRAAAAGTSCQTSGPASAAYSVTVCIEAPADGAALTGAAPVSGTAVVTPAATAQGVQRMIFSLDGQYLLTDYAADGSGKYGFSLKSARFLDGAHTLSAQVLLRDGFTSGSASIALSFANGVSQPPVNTNSFTPTAGSDPAPGAPFVLAASGDGAGGEIGETRVTNLIDSWNPNLFLYLGDVYEKGTSTEFDNWYGPAGVPGLYGHFRAITDPTVGNHEYVGGVAPGYFDYWDNVPSYYSVNTHGWHLISLNSNAELGQFGPGSPQYDWLANDLQTNTQPCVLAYFHHPRFNIGQEGMSTRMDPVWALLAQRGADLVLNGHDHSYQRWQPLDAAGTPSPTGTTEIVVGTGGHALQSFVQSDSRVAAAFSKQFGSLRLELNPAGAGFRFVNTDGVTLDSGSVACHGAAGASPDAAAPTVPAGLQASALSRSQIRLTWMAATDNVGVTGYDIYRDGALLAHTGPDSAYTDGTPTPGVTHTYEVAARDAAGNVSAHSAAASAATDPVALLFSDDFESGGLGAWTSVNGLTVGQTQVFSGANAARATSTGSPSWAARTVTPQDQLYYQMRFKILSRGASNVVNLLSFDNSTGTRLGTLSLSTGGRLAFTGIATGSSNPTVSENVWHTVQVRFLSNGAASQSEVWLDGARIDQLSATIAAGGSGQIAAIELGDGVAGHTFDVAYDDVAVDPQLIADVIAPSAPTGLTATAASGLEIDLAWQAGADDVGVTSYDVYRDCSPASGDPGCTAIASVGGSATAYADTAVSPLSSHFYVVVARDGGGNASAPSNVASADTPVVFSDGFESGDLARWTTVQGLVVGTSPVNAGAFAARATSAGSGSAYAVKTLGAGLTEIYARVRFKVVSQGAYQVTLLRLATGAGAPLVTLALSPTARLLSQNGPAATTTTSTLAVPPGAWHELQVHLLVAGSSGRSDVWLDGSQVAALSGSADFGSTPAARLQIGEDTASGKTYDIAFDEVLADTSFIVDTTPPSAPTGLTANVASGGGVDLAWQPASDNLGVTGYEVFRNGTQIASLGAVTSFRDAAVAPSTAYAYRVSAMDAGGNTSAQSGAANVTTPAPITTTQTLTPTADAYVNGASTGTNYGTLASLRVDASPDTRSYLRFSVSGLTGAPSKATLRVYATSAQTTGYDAFVVADTTWSESGITYLNAPAFGAKAGSSGAVATGTWTSVDVTPLITGNGTYSLGLSTTNSTALALASRESGANAPQLVVVPSAAPPPPDNQAPSVPTGLSATAISATRVDLGWSASTDNVGVTGYAIYREGTQIGSVGGSATTYSDTTAAPSTTYHYTVDAVDAATNRSAQSSQAIVTTPAAADNQAPSVPTGLSATAISATRVDLGWSASTDNVGVTGYAIYREGTQIGSVGGSATTYSDTTAAPSTTYHYTVDAVDAATNRSAQSSQAIVTTPAAADTQAPSVPTGLSATAISATRVDLGWSASTDNVGVTGYAIYREGTQIGTVGGSATTYSDTIAAPSTTYHYTVDAVDAATNRSAQSSQAIVTTPAAADTQAPSVPTGLSATAISATRVDLGWSASTDNVGVTGYAIYREGTQIGTVGGSATTYSDTIAAPSTTYHYTVDAVDAATNRSAQSSQAIVTTPAATATTVTLAPVADAYVNGGSTTTKYGTTTSLRVDASPDTRSYLRFSVTGLAGPVSKATLRVWATSAQSTGYSVFPVADTSWSETTITYANAPPFGATKVGSSGAVATGTWTSVDVTSLITGNGTYGLGLSTTSSTALSLASRESGATTAPQLVVQTSGGAPPPDTQAPTVPTGLNATAITSTRVDLSWSASTDNVGVTGYAIYREGTQIGSVNGSTTSFSDTTAAPTTTYHYTVDAVDAANNRSAQSGQATATTPAAADGQAPSVPTGLSANAISPTRVDLSWSASTDNVGVTGYAIYRGGAQIGSVNGSTTSYSDTTASPNTTYQYTVDAVDAANNRSAQSSQATATTPAAPTTITLAPVADAYVAPTGPSNKFGTSTSLKVDASPDTRSYLRFTVSGLTGPVTRATLRVWATSAQSTGYGVFAVADNSWTESAITYANAPAFGPTRIGSSGAVATGSWTSVDVTSLITGNGTYSLGLSTTSSTALSLASRESGATTAPQLVITP